MRKFYVVGMGPGSEEYLLPVAVRAIAEADVLIGAARFLARYPQKRHVVIEGSVSSIIESIERERAGARLAVLVSGDPGLFSLQRAISRHFDPQDYVVVPGISSFQIACARAGITWEDALIVSVHGRDTSGLGRIEPGRAAVIFTDRDRTPQLVAAILAAGGNGGRRCIVVENAGEKEERIVDAGLDAVALMSFSGLSVMVLP
jgi:precorrin-6y C5,15-methyltransferase (decarboxylating) CbiE subunit